MPVAISPASARSRSSGSEVRAAGERRGQIGATAGRPPAARLVGREAGRRDHERNCAPTVSGRPARNSRALITRRPSGWSSRIRSTSPSPAATARTSPALRRSCRRVRRARSPVSCGAVQQVRAVRRGAPTPAARAAGRAPGCECARPAAVQSIGALALGHLVRRRCAFAWSCGVLDERCRRRSARRPPAAAPRRSRASACSTSTLVSSAPIGPATVANIGPASSSCTTRMMVTPVSRRRRSPRGAPARRRGSAGRSEACTLIMPSRGIASSVVGQDLPVGRDHAEVEARDRGLRGERPRREFAPAAAPERQPASRPPSSASAAPGVRALSADRAATRLRPGRGANRSVSAASARRNPACRRTRSAAAGCVTICRRASASGSCGRSGPA